MTRRLVALQVLDHACIELLASFLILNNNAMALFNLTDR